MSMKWIIAAIAVGGWCGTASAQLFGQPGMGGYGPSGLGPNGGFMPNIYNSQMQPLSPYMNMFRGSGNPAANYYFGTRPGTVGGGGGMMWGGAPNMSMGGFRGQFFPQYSTGPDQIDLPEADPTSNTALPPAGHPVFYNNTMGYFPMPFGNRGMQGMGMGNRGQQQPTPRRR